MKTIVIANQKGGVGKTAMLVHLAFYLSELGVKTVVVDLDVQGNTSQTLDRYKSELSAAELIKGEKVPGVVFKEKEIETLCLIPSESRLADIDNLSLGEAAKNIRAGLEALAANGFEICLVDTPPSLGHTMVSPLYSADYVLSPIDMSIFAISGLKLMVKTIQNARKVNKKLKFLGMLPNRIDKRLPTHMEQLRKIREAYGDAVIPLEMYQRSMIEQALALKTPVWSIKGNSTARKTGRELKKIFDVILDRVGVKHG